MDRLIELLNQYEAETFEGLMPIEWGEYQDGFFFEKGFCEEEGESVVMQSTHLISKKYGFIEWLFDKGQIDLDKLDNEKGNDYDHFSYVPTLIQMLSIQDNPIDLLIELIK